MCSLVSRHPRRNFICSLIHTYKFRLGTRLPPHTYLYAYRSTTLFPTRTHLSSFSEGDGSGRFCILASGAARGLCGHRQKGGGHATTRRTHQDSHYHIGKVACCYILCA
jgi:hypothetical protein